MNWFDQGIVLSARKYGENSLIVALMTGTHGKHSGLVRGGTSKRVRGIYEPGNFVTANWNARLEDHLGIYTCELVASKAALILNDPLLLSGLSSACAVTECAFPEREPHSVFFNNFRNLVASLDSPNWVEHYVFWEIRLLTELGFGLDLSACAATGNSDQLVYVSPKSGKAVSKVVGEPYHHKLLPLPGFLTSNYENAGSPSTADLAAGLEMAEYFLKRNIFIHIKGGEPPARTRFVDRLKQLATISSA